MNKVYLKALSDATTRLSQSTAEIESEHSRNFSRRPFQFHFRGDPYIPISIIFSTSNGIYILDTHHRTQHQILKGKYYGIAKAASCWFFSRSNNKGSRDHTKNDRISDISCAQIMNNQITNYKIMLFGIPAEVHQIDIFNGELIFPHTGYNQILSIDLAHILQSNHPIWFDALQSIPLPIITPSHLNSIYVTNEAIYLIAHNYTMKTGRLSDLIKYNKKNKTIEITALHAHSAHNICKQQNDFYYCDSNNKKLYKNQTVFFEADKLLRGLSMNDDYIFVGGSDICFDNYKRFSNTPSIYILERTTGKHISTIILPDLGDLYEIRQLHGIDYTRSGQ